MILAVVLAGMAFALLDGQPRPIDGALPAKGTMALHFIDVGQGDSMVGILPDSRAILIDAGTDKMSERVVNYLKGLGLRRIDFLVATHPHEDHIGGMDEVVEAFEIGAVYMPKVSHNTRTFEQLLEAIARKGLKVNTAKAGVVIAEGDGFRVELVAPLGEEYKSLNDYSAATRITHGGVAFLSTGDAEARSEMEMVESGQSLRAQLLKVGHHGSNTSTTEEFLKAVSPEIAVLSLGADNSYGHPAPRVVRLLEKYNTEIFRTDRDGTIVAVSDGNSIQIRK